MGMPDSLILFLGSGPEPACGHEAIASTRQLPNFSQLNQLNQLNQPYRYAASCCRAAAMRSSYRSPMASSCCLSTMFSPRFSKWYSLISVSTIESTGQDSSQKPQ